MIAMSRIRTNCVAASSASARPRRGEPSSRDLVEAVTASSFGSGVLVPFRASVYGPPVPLVNDFQLGFGQMAGPTSSPVASAEPRPQRADARRNRERILEA